MTDIISLFICRRLFKYWGKGANACLWLWMAHNHRQVST